jgi:hypothetical protein
MSKCTCDSPCGGTAWYCPSNPHYDLPMLDNPSYQKYVHDTNLDSFDKRIAELERQLNHELEFRREYINRYNLNRS